VGAGPRRPPLPRLEGLGLQTTELIKLCGVTVVPP